MKAERQPSISIPILQEITKKVSKNFEENIRVFRNIFADMPIPRAVWDKSVEFGWAISLFSHEIKNGGGR
jgi:hypothetical protein